MSQPIRAFHWSTRAWYASVCHRPDVVESIMFGHYNPEGGTTGEMEMRWENLGGNACPRLCVFDDAWAVLATFPDLIARLGELDNQRITAEAFVALLLSLGFKDLTAYETPARYRDQDHPIP